jgi:hypothetical protein
MHDSQNDNTTVLLKIGDNIRQSADNQLSGAHNPTGACRFPAVPQVLNRGRTPFVAPPRTPQPGQIKTKSLFSINAANQWGQTRLIFTRKSIKMKSVTLFYAPQNTLPSKSPPKF